MAILLSMALPSCSGVSPNAAALWTDIPEFAVYAEVFNSENGRYRVEVSYKENLVRDFEEARAKPEAIAGRWIRDSGVRPSLRSLDHLFSELRLNARDFYADFLAQGKIEGRQLLIPVSFNLPSIVFKDGASAAPGSSFFIGLDELEAQGKAYNERKSGAFSRMGFSPRWNPEFLYLLSSLYGASFQQGKPIAIDERGLKTGVERARDWILDANSSAREEDEFSFKYLYDPGYSSASSGRILFTYMDSGDFFSLPEQKRTGLSFRWILHDGRVPVKDDMVYLGLGRSGRGRQAAEAFASWFFNADNQRRLLEDSHSMRMSEIVFGIAGGFSSIREVNEKYYPAYYPDLLGHMPPDGPFLVPKPLPGNWPVLKREVVLPFLEEQCSRSRDEALPSKADFDESLATWLRENPDDF